VSNGLTDVLQQYGLDPSSAHGTLLSQQLNGTAPAPVSPQAPPADPAIGANPTGQMQQALAYAKQLQEQFRAPVHQAAQAASNLPGMAGAAGTAVAQATAPQEQQPTNPAMLQQLIKQHESSGNYSAVNKHSTASGAYQNTDGNWGGYGGYAHAALAPRAVQDAKAHQDIAANLERYGGDPFKAIAAHYLPAAAHDPANWTKPYTLHSGKTVAPVADYVRATVANTPLQGQFDAYLRQYSSS
jgi:hypothetical protein